MMKCYLFQECILNTSMLMSTYPPSLFEWIYTSKYRHISKTLGNPQIIVKFARQKNSSCPLKDSMSSCLTKNCILGPPDKLFVHYPSNNKISLELLTIYKLTDTFTPLTLGLLQKSDTWCVSSMGINIHAHHLMPPYIFAS